MWRSGLLLTLFCGHHGVSLQEHYEAPRRSTNLAMIAALDSIKAAFGPQARPIAALRNAGLDLINAVGPVRDRIMKYAMGL